MVKARPYIRRPFYPSTDKSSHLLWEQFYSKKWIIRAIKHIVGIVKLDEVRLKMLQSMSFDICPQDINHPDIGEPSFVPYRTRVKQGINNLDVVLKSDFDISPMSDGAIKRLRFQGHKINTENVIEMIKRYYKKNNIFYDNEVDSINKPYGNIKVSLHEGVKVPDNFNVPIMVIITKGKINLEYKSLDGWEYIRNRDGIVFVNLEGNNFPQDVEFSGKGDILLTTYHTWDYNKGKHESGLFIADNRWSKSNVLWTDGNRKWKELNLTNYKKPKKNISKKAGDNGSKTSDTDTKILY